MPRTRLLVMQPGHESFLKKVSVYVIGSLIFGGLLLICVLLMRGMVWASEVAMPWLVRAAQIALDICVFIFVPLCIFRKIRPWVGVGFYVASYVFGICLFGFSCLFVVYIWGYGGLFAGLVLGGIGVVPVAFLAALLHAHWDVLGELVLAI